MHTDTVKVTRNHSRQYHPIKYRLIENQRQTLSLVKMAELSRVLLETKPIIW